jgi:hypothetical protein
VNAKTYDPTRNNDAINTIVGNNKFAQLAARIFVRNIESEGATFGNCNHLSALLIQGFNKRVAESSTCTNYEKSVVTHFSHSVSLVGSGWRTRTVRQPLPDNFFRTARL